VQAKDLPSPIAPESDEEKPLESDEKKSDEKKPDENAKQETVVHVDLENIGQRILALPIPARNYIVMSPGKPGVLFLLEAPPTLVPGAPQLTLYMFDLKTRKTDRIREGISAFVLSANGEKMLYRQGEEFFIAAAGKQPPTPPPPGEGGGPLKLDGMESYVDPQAEWKHMYQQVWRDERDFFYDPGLHGLNLAGIEKKHEPYLDNIASRDALNYLFEEMLGEMTVGHMFGGGDKPETKKVKVGLLGADYTVENGRYRFARVYNGENWNPQLKAPLTQPGVNVMAGEYLLSVQGRDVRPPQNLYSFFEETAGKSIVIRVGPDPNGANSREATVVPVESETAMHNLS
jgi:tricorn protease